MASQKVDLEMVLELENANSFLIRYQARTTAKANNIQFTTASGGKELVFHGYAPPNKTTSLILRMPGVPFQAVDGYATIDGTFEYDVLFFNAADSNNHEENRRRTARKVAFGRRFPATAQVGTREVHNTHLLFHDEIEE